MRNLKITFLFSLCLLACGGNATVPSTADMPDRENAASQSATDPRVDLAARYLRKDQFETNTARICDDSLLWRIIFLDDLTEVSISKLKQTVLGAETLRDNFDYSGNSPGIRSTASEEKNALAISENYVRRILTDELNADLTVFSNEYYPRACDLGQFWRILYIRRGTENLTSADEIQRLPNFTPPNTLVDKTTGKIIYSNYRPSP